MKALSVSLSALGLLKNSYEETSQQQMMLKNAIQFFHFSISHLFYGFDCGYVLVRPKNITAEVA